MPLLCCAKKAKGPTQAGAVGGRPQVPEHRLGLILTKRVDRNAMDNTQTKDRALEELVSTDSKRAGI